MTSFRTLATSVTLVAAATLSSNASAVDVRIGTEGAYAPWNYIDEAGKLAGFEIDLGNEICTRAAIDCEWVENEWESIIPNLQAGNYDMIMASLSVTDERRESILFSEAYYPPEPSRFVAGKSAEFDFDKLVGLKIGAQGGTIQAAYAQENFGAENTILMFETPDQSVADLATGDLDLILADASFLEPIVDGSGGAMVFAGPDVAIGDGFAAGFRVDETELAEKVNDALESMKQDGSLDQLRIAYFGEALPFPED